MNVNDKPIIKLFIFLNKYYVYDAFSNHLFELSANHFKEVLSLNKIGLTRFLNQKKNNKEYEDICMMITKGMFKSSIIRDVENYLTPYIEQLLKTCVNDLILQVTQDCNFKCRYCSYAIDSGIDRNHSNKTMSWDIAKKSIDFLYSHSRDMQEITVSFYGGEPLLNFDLIKKVVEYTKVKFITRKIKFRMTTNVTILNREILEFLVINSFKLSLSIDGPEYIQNSHRILKLNGKGTFEIVMTKLNLIKEKYPEYFQSNISVVPVVVEDEDFNLILEYFGTLGFSRDNINLLNANMSGVDYIPSNIFKRNNDFKLTNVSGLEIIKKYEEIYHNKDILPEKWHHNGTCIPGVKRLFVDINGCFFPCEKILLRENLSIGNLSDGFNVDKIINFSNIGKINSNRCKKCWAIRFCNICVGQCNDIENNELSIKQKNYMCDNVETNTVWFFKNKILRIKKEENYE